MSSLRPQDRASSCRFTFADGRQCRTPRSLNHPHLCSDHARKDSQARAAESAAAEEKRDALRSRVTLLCALRASVLRSMPLDGAFILRRLEPPLTRAQSSENAIWESKEELKGGTVKPPPALRGDFVWNHPPQRFCARNRELHVPEIRFR